MSMRKDFEAWYCDSDEGPECEKSWMTQESDGRYSLLIIQEGWGLWQASRAAVVIELPEPLTPETFGVTQPNDPEQYKAMEARHGAQCAAIDQCRKSIEAVGFKVKV